MTNGKIIKQPTRGRGNNDNNNKKPQPRATQVKPAKVDDFICPFCNIIVRPFQEVDVFLKGDGRALHESCVRNNFHQLGFIQGRTMPNTPSKLSSFLKAKLAELAATPFTRKTRIEIEQMISATQNFHEAVFGQQIQLSSIISRMPMPG